MSVVLPQENMLNSQTLSCRQDHNTLSESTTEFAQEETKEAKYICLYMVEKDPFIDRVQTSIKVVDLSKLFSCERHANIDSISQILFTTSKTYLEHTGTGMAATTDGSLYVATAEYPTESPCQMFKYRPAANHQLQRVEDDNFTSSWSGKFFPILVQIKQCMYVLHNPYNTYYQVEKPFEAYDLTHHVWKTLEPPPFMRETLLSVFYLRCIDSYIVVGKYICVSTTHMSYAFDTESEKWERCDLFSTFYAKDYPLDWETKVYYESYLRNHDTYRNHSTVEDDMEDEMGVPFPTVDTGLVYDGYLLCIMLPFYRDVVAFKIVDGKLVEPEILLKQPKPVRAFDRCFLLALGGGEFCLVTLYRLTLEFTRFKVLKSSGGGLHYAEAEVKVSTVILAENEDRAQYIACSGAVAL